MVLVRKHQRLKNQKAIKSEKTGQNEIIANVASRLGSDFLRHMKLVD
jgi:hypothetical protein